MAQLAARVARPDHELADGRKVSVEDLILHDIVLPSDDFGITRLVRSAAGFGKIAFHAVATANQLSFLTDFSIRTGAIIFAPLQAVAKEVAEGKLSMLNLQCKEFVHRHIFLVRRKDHVANPATNAFMKMVGAGLLEIASADGDWIKTRFPGYS